MTPYFSDPSAGITLYHGDCRDILPALELPADAVVVVDPPYGIAHESSRGASWHGTQIGGDHSTELRDWLIDFLSPRPMAVFGIWKRPRPETVRGILVWDKGPASGAGDLSFPWKPSWEEIYIIGDGWTGRRDEGVLRGYTQLSWESKGRTHPHAKPSSLMAHLVSKHPASTVIDPCCGSGPTLRAAKDLGRRAIGIEISERYCEITAKRLAQEVLF